MNRTRAWVLGILGVIFLSFLTAAGLVQWQMRTVDRLALEIEHDAVPRIEHLAAARGDVRHLQVVLRDALDHRARGETIDPALLESSHEALARSLGGYLGLPPAPGEHVAREDILAARHNLEAAVGRVEDRLRAGDASGATSAASMDVGLAASALNDAIGRTIASNAGRTRELALEIRGLRSRSAEVAFGLGAVCVVITVAGVFLLRRTLRDHEALVDRNLRLEAERSTELEHFAARVAHDILSPLGTVGFALQLALRGSDDAHRRKIVERGSAALQRVTTLVHGLLEFARAAGAPTWEGGADVRAAVDDLVTELQESAPEVRFRTRVVTRAFVACHPGVLTSLLANLLRNAVKYIGRSPLRRIEVRALPRGPFVRIEVEDSGPGLSPEIERRVFEPYVRGRESGAAGIGLGLATVKRLAEAHGGRVGVQSVPGRGCTFWFELPTAARPSEAKAALPRPVGVSSS